MRQLTNRLVPACELPPASTPAGQTVRRLLSVHLAAVIFLLPALGRTEGLSIVQVRADELVWLQTPSGMHQATLVGDPGKGGLYVMRGKLPPGFRIAPHSHPDERVVTVVSGTLYLGFGEQFDETKLKALPPGSLWTEPGGRPHFVWAKDGEVVFQVNGMGPTATTPVQIK